MHNNTPIIHSMVENGKCYVYDTNNNEILQVEENIFKEIKKLQIMGFEKYLSSKDNTKEKAAIIDMMDKGFFSCHIIKEFEHSLTKFVEIFPERKTNNLILQVTKNCNFKCRYCSFTDIDSFRRNHSEIKMSWEIAKAAIDFLYHKSKDCLDIRIGFYGGEPFLEFPLIKKCINYAESLFETKNVTFYATTNGSILNDSIVEFLFEHNLKLRVSLDGPEDIQNKHRRFSSNGLGTYKNVIENLLNIRTKYPEYFKTIIFNPVIFNDENISYVRSFFINELNIPEENITPSFADTRGFDYIGNPKQQNVPKVNSDMFNKMMNRGEITEYVSKILMRKSKLPDKISHSGPCLAGSTKLFCSTEGIFYPCEKITECEWSSIGNLQDGYNFQKINELLNICQLSKDLCEKCWAIRFCKICPAQCCNGSSTNVLSLKKNMCDYIRSRADKGLRKYINSSKSFDGRKT